MCYLHVHDGVDHILSSMLTSKVDKVSQVDSDTLLDKMLEHLSLVGSRRRLRSPLVRLKFRLSVCLSVPTFKR